jgi:hypothetical protein
MEMKKKDSDEKMFIKKKWFITSRKGKVEDFYDFNIRNVFLKIIQLISY